MFRRPLSFPLTVAALLLSVHFAPAQGVAPPRQKIPLPAIEGLPPDLQAQLERLLDPNLVQPLQARPGLIETTRWGGLRLNKVAPELQTKLGLPEKEGLLVAAVEPNSASEKAGLKTDDVLVKINSKPVPNDLTAFHKLVQDQPPNEAMEIVVVRDGKEETIKGARMPALVQNPPDVFNPGLRLRPGFRGMAQPRLPFQQGLPLPIDPFPFNGPLINPLQPGALQNLHMEMNINGAKVVRDQKGNQFSGEYSKGELKITLAGQIVNGLTNVSEITVQEGKELKKYAAVKDVPAQHRAAVQQLMPSPFQGLMMFPALPNLRDFPGLPVIPGVDN